jgi:hypothetical protein
MKAFSIASSANTAPVAASAFAKICTPTNKPAKEKLPHKSARESFKANGNPWMSANIKLRQPRTSDRKQVIAQPRFKYALPVDLFSNAEFIDFRSTMLTKDDL